VGEALVSIELGTEFRGAVCEHSVVKPSVAEEQSDMATLSAALTSCPSEEESRTILPALDDDSCSSATRRIRMKRVLVVDDAISNRKVLCRLLRNNGYDCVEMENGAEAVSLLKETPPALCPFDFILMDYEMPIMNGPEATKVLRALGLKVPIIGVTGNVMVEDSRDFITNGANFVLHKPLSIEKLRGTLSSLDLSEDSL
jgi:CheY-like chemotaxis protein